MIVLYDAKGGGGGGGVSSKCHNDVNFFTDSLDVAPKASVLRHTKDKYS